MTRRLQTTPYIVLTESDYHVLGPREFGTVGLKAIESIGPFVDIQASGPLVTVHDATIEPHLGIGHHPHRYNERLFYILSGQLDHDDALNQIQGHVEQGDVALFTEGRRGMLHSEWNNGDVPTRCYILVYSTNPVPEKAAFAALRDAEAPRYDEGPGTHTKELVGPRSPLRVQGDVRLVTDTRLEDRATLTLALKDGEGALLSVQEGRVLLDRRGLDRGMTLIVPPGEGERPLTVQAEGRARLIRAVYGPGYGFVRQ